MNTASLKIFVAVVESGSFSKAASQLGLSQPAISMSIRNLEKDLEVKLLERSRERCRPTEAGKLLLRHAREILNAEERLYRALGEAREEVRGKLNLLSSNIPGEYIIPPIIGEFKERYPSVELSLEIVDSYQVVEGIKSKKAEIGFVGIDPGDSSLMVRDLCRDQLLVVASIDHPLSAKGMVNPDELQEESYVLREKGSGTRELMLKSLESLGVDTRRLKVVSELGSTGAVLSAVEAGIGISMASIWSAAPLLKDGRITHVRVKGLDAYRTFHVIHRKSAAVSSAAEVFLQFLEEKRPQLQGMVGDLMA